VPHHHTALHLQVPDLPAVARFARQHNLTSVIDATFATPVLLRPVRDLGFDVVLHSATKYLNGHSDLIAGARCGLRAAATGCWQCCRWPPSPKHTHTHTQTHTHTPPLTCSVARCQPLPPRHLPHPVNGTGVVAASRELIVRIRSKVNHFGGSIDPHAAFLLQRGIKTLALRVERQSANALALATALQAHPLVRGGARLGWRGGGGWG
jgi:hypothetical protein